MGALSTSGIFTFTIIVLSCYTLTKCAAQNAELSSPCCDWDRDYRVNEVPHPTICSAFYQCEPWLSPNGWISLVPTMRQCPLDEEGNTMYFDFPTCRCVRWHEVTCYNDDIQAHYYDFFNCSQKFYEGGSTLAC